MVGKEQEKPEAWRKGEREEDPRHMKKGVDPVRSLGIG